MGLSVSANAGAEASTTVITVTATAEAAVNSAATVDVAVSGTGITASDYTLSANQITIASGQTTGSVTFTVVDDTAFEGAETATLTISNPSAGLALGATTSQNVSIADNEETPSTVVTIAADVVNSADGQISLREAIAYANSGDTVTFDASLSTIDLPSDIDITKTITIDGDHTGGDDVADITLMQSTVGLVFNRHFEVFSGATLNLESLVLSDGEPGTGTQGGSVKVNSGGTLSATNTTFTASRALDGGAIWSAGTVTLTGTEFTNNTAGAGNGRGRAIWNSGTLTINDSTFAGNQTSPGAGGAIYNEGLLTVRNTTFSQNTAFQGDGGAIFTLSGNANATIENSTFFANHASGTGGAITSNVNTVLDNNLFVSNTQGLPGGQVRFSGPIPATNIVTSDTAAVFGTNTLADNSGPVRTIALNADLANPALDVGSSTLAADARGQARRDVPGAGNNGTNFADAGAFELQASEPPARSVTLSVSANAGTEAGTTAITVTATADGPVAGAQSVDVAVSGTDVTAGDYTLFGHADHDCGRAELGNRYIHSGG